MPVHIPLNAMRDDFTGQVTTLSDDDRPVFEQLTLRMLCALEPCTELETFLAHAITWDNWRLNRLRAIETNMYALGLSNSVEKGDPRLQAAMATTATFAAEARTMVAMSLCEQRLNRNLHKNLATLRELQAERQQKEIPGPNGFVFSNSKIPSRARLATVAAAKEAA